MTASISTDLLAVIALCLTIYLARRNIIFNNNKNMIYISVAMTTIILLLLEIATVLIEHSGSSNFEILHFITNMIGFSLCPVVPVLLLFFNKDMKIEKVYKSFLALPLYFNCVMCILSYKTGWIFLVGAHNQYTRGSFFLLPSIVSLFYFILLAFAVVKNRAEYETDDMKILVSLFFIPVIGTIVQVLYKNVLLIWISTALSLLLYYIFLREQQFKYDIQTGIKNRSAFEKEMEKYLKDDRNAAIVMADLNNLKRINDKHGHKAGDEIIKCAAKIVEESFLGIGKTFRIGGDEFCVLCMDIPKELLESALSDLDHLVKVTNQKRDIKIVLAYGYAFYTKNESESIYSAFAEADKAMYTHKAKLKDLYGRRAEDE